MSTGFCDLCKNADFFFILLGAEFFVIFVAKNSTIKLCDFVWLYDTSYILLIEIVVQYREDEQKYEGCVSLYQRPG